MGLCWDRWAAGWSMRGAVLVWLYCLDSSKGACWWCWEKSSWWKFSSWTGEVCSTGLSRLPHWCLTGGLRVAQKQNVNFHKLLNTIFPTILLGRQRQRTSLKWILKCSCYSCLLGSTTQYKFVNIYKTILQLCVSHCTHQVTRWMGNLGKVYYAQIMQSNKQRWHPNFPTPLS